MEAVKPAVVLVLRVQLPASGVFLSVDSVLLQGTMDYLYGITILAVGQAALMVYLLIRRR